MAEIFHDSFCEHFHVPPERYEQEILQRTLTPGARVLQGFLRLTDRNYFAVDREFIAAIGRLTRHGDFHAEAQDFHDHPDNRGYLRRALRLRVSATLMRGLIDQVWPDFAARRTRSNPSLSPFTPRSEPPSPPTAGAPNL